LYKAVVNRGFLKDRLFLRVLQLELSSKELFEKLLGEALSW
jgi:hypothetical protein